jgi:hypothetical protein
MTFGYVAVICLPDVIPAKAGIHASIHGRDAGRILARGTQ